MEIRPYREEDRPALHRITIDCFPEVSIHSLAEKTFGVLGGEGWEKRKTADVDADLEAAPEGTFAAVEAEEIAGFITARLDHSTGVGWIHNLAVAPAHQGKGIGSALIRRALDYFTEHGMTHAKIETLVGNEAGAHLYPKLGFREIARQIHYMMELPIKADLRPKT